MNLQEFAALKVGDKIESWASGVSHGEVVETTDAGVRVVWGARHAHETRFFYAVMGTAWMHWSRAEPDCPGLAECTNERCRKSEQCLGGSKADYDKWAGA